MYKVRFNQRAMAISSDMVEKLNDPKTINLGADLKKGVIAICCNQPNAKEYTVVQEHDGKRRVVLCPRFINVIKEHCSLSFNSVYRVYWDERNKRFLVFLRGGEND